MKSLLFLMNLSIFYNVTDYNDNSFIAFLLQKVEIYKKFRIFYIFLVIYEQKSPSTANIYI